MWYAQMSSRPQITLQHENVYWLLDKVEKYLGHTVQLFKQCPEDVIVHAKTGAIVGHIRRLDETTGKTTTFFPDVLSPVLVGIEVAPIPSKRKTKKMPKPAEVRRLKLVKPSPKIKPKAKAKRRKTG